MMDERGKRRLMSSSVWAAQPALFEEVLHILFKNDPVLICSPANPRRYSEYAAEVETIVPRLPAAISVDDVQDIVYEEFYRWFDTSARTRDHYRTIAEEIWDVYQKNAGHDHQRIE